MWFHLQIAEFQGHLNSRSGHFKTVTWLVSALHFIVTCGTIRVCIHTGRREGGGKDEEGCREKEGGEKEEWETWLIWLCATDLIQRCASLASFQDPALLSFQDPALLSFQDPALLSIDCSLQMMKSCVEPGNEVIWYWSDTIVVLGSENTSVSHILGNRTVSRVNFTGYTTKTQRSNSLQMQLGHWAWVLMHVCIQAVSPLAHVGHMHVAYQISV